MPTGSTSSSRQAVHRSATGLRVEDVGLAEAQVEDLEPLRVLVQQVAQIGGRSVSRRDRQQHSFPFSSVAQPQSHQQIVQCRPPSRTFR